MNGPRRPDALVFVYNADGGLFSAVADIAHKIFSPETYACPLCRLTHGYFTMRADTRRLIDALGVTCRFLHRDEFLRRYGDAPPLPAVFRDTNGRLRQCLGRDDLLACRHLDDLRAALERHCLDTSASSEPARDA